MFITLLIIQRDVARETSTVTNHNVSDLEEQCTNLTQCIERLTMIIEHHPGRKDLYLLRTLMENALNNLNEHYLGKVSEIPMEKEAHKQP